MVDAEATIIKNKTITVIMVLSRVPIISVGFVSIFPISSSFWWKITSAPTTIKTAKNENIIRFKNKLKLPFFNSSSSLT